MTMHVVLGDGEMPKKALTESLQDLWERAEKEGQTFWFLVQGKDEPTTTDRNLMAWVAENEIYFEVLSDGGSEISDIYEGSQAKHTAKRIAPKVVTLMKTLPEEEEDADILALFASDDGSAEEDMWLNEVIQATGDADFKTYALNDGLMEVEMGTSEEEPEEEEAPPPPAKKVAAKKAAAPAKKAAARQPEPEEEEEETGEITREFLENQTLDTLKELAANRGIELPPRTRSQTYIDKILGEDEELAEVEVEEVAYQGGNALVGLAMVVVVYNGQVISRAISKEEAEAIIKA